MSLLSGIVSRVKELCGYGAMGRCPRVTVDEGGFAVEGTPFRIRGVTCSHRVTEADIERIAEMGANAIRTWGTDDHTPVLMDLAHKHGIKVLLGIWMRHGKPGAEGDDSFDWLHDEKGKAVQLAKAAGAVKKYRYHPALLGWNIGNEVTLNIETGPEKIAYARHLEATCRIVKKLDPNHPIASVSAWTTDVPFWETWCKSVDIYGINVYGYGVYEVPHALKHMGVSKPYFLGEFGVTGEWEARADENGVKAEPGDRQKYEIFARNWERIETTSGPRFAGGFLFNYADDFSFAGVWLSFFVNGCFRPSYWGARKAFTGKDPVHRMPLIKSFGIVNCRASHPCGDWIEVKLDYANMEENPGTIRFFYNQRTGSRAERNAVLPLDSRPGTEAGRHHLRLPRAPGPTKLYVFVEDAHSNLAIASTSAAVASGADELHDGENAFPLGPSPC
jgi:hypothetical protein